MTYQKSQLKIQFTLAFKTITLSPSNINTCIMSLIQLIHQYAVEQDSVTDINLLGDTPTELKNQSSSNEYCRILP